jgi:hypothetical protein
MIMKPTFIIKSTGACVRRQALQTRTSFANSTTSTESQKGPSKRASARGAPFGAVPRALLRCQSRICCAR